MSFLNFFIPNRVLNNTPSLFIECICFLYGFITLPKNQTGDEEPDDIGEPGGGSVPPSCVLPYIGIMLSWSRSSFVISFDIEGLARARPYSSRSLSLERDLSRLVLVDDGDGDLLRKSLPSLRGLGLVTRKFLSGC